MTQHVLLIHASAHLHAKVLGHKLGPSDNGNVLQQRLAALTKAGCLDRHHIEDTAQLVHNKCRQGLTCRCKLQQACGSGIAAPSAAHDDSNDDSNTAGMQQLGVCVYEREAAMLYSSECVCVVRRVCAVVG